MHYHLLHTFFLIETEQTSTIGVRKLCWYRLDTLLYLFLYTPFLGSHISGLFGCIDSPSAGGLRVFRASAYIDGSPVLGERYISSCWHCCCVVRCFSCCFLLFVNASTTKRLLLLVAHRHIVTTRFNSHHYSHRTFHRFSIDRKGL